VNAGEKTIPVAANTGFMIGHKVKIAPGTDKEEANEIVGFGSLLLKEPLQFSHDAGVTISVITSEATTTTTTILAGESKCMSEEDIQTKQIQMIQQMLADNNLSTGCYYAATQAPGIAPACAATEHTCTRTRSYKANYTCPQAIQDELLSRCPGLVTLAKESGWVDNHTNTDNVCVASPCDNEKDLPVYLELKALYYKRELCQKDEAGNLTKIYGKIEISIENETLSYVCDDAQAQVTLIRALAGEDGVVVGGAKMAGALSVWAAVVVMLAAAFQ
jgi:hypothetical protein